MKSQNEINKERKEQAEEKATEPTMSASTGTLLVVAGILLVPLISILAVNELFGAGIEINMLTMASALWLIAVIRL
jgi:hypothetical protein